MPAHIEDCRNNQTFEDQYGIVADEGSVNENGLRVKQLYCYDKKKVWDGKADKSQNANYPFPRRFFATGCPVVKSEPTDETHNCGGFYGTLEVVEITLPEGLEDSHPYYFYLNEESEQGLMAKDGIKQNGNAAPFGENKAYIYRNLKGQE